MALAGQIAIDLQVGTADFVKGMQKASEETKKFTDSVKTLFQSSLDSATQGLAAASTESLGLSGSLAETVVEMGAASASTKIFTATTEAAAAAMAEMGLASTVALFGIPAAAVAAAGAIAYVSYELKVINNLNSGLYLTAEALEEIAKAGDKATEAIKRLENIRQDRNETEGLLPKEKLLRQFDISASAKRASIEAMRGIKRQETFPEYLMGLLWGNPEDKDLIPVGEIEGQLTSLDAKRQKFAKDAADERAAFDAAAKKKSDDAIGREQVKEMEKALNEQNRAFEKRTKDRETLAKESAKRIWEFEKAMEREFFKKQPREKQERFKDVQGPGTRLAPGAVFGSTEAYSLLAKSNPNDPVLRELRDANKKLAEIRDGRLQVANL